MANKRKIINHVQLQIAAALGTAIVFIIAKALLRRTGHDDWTKDF
jgi:hypothetical protein